MLKRRIKWLFLVSAVAVLSSTFFAPARVWPEFFFEDYNAPTQLDIVVGETKVINISKPQRIAIGDPDIADVASASNSELLLSAKKPGETNLQIWDEYGKREIQIRVFEENLGKLKERLEDLFKIAGLHGVSFRIGDHERKVFVLGEVPKRKQEVVEQLLKNFNEKVINLVAFPEDSPVVEIDVQILEINKTAVDKLGINWTTAFTFNEDLSSEPHTLNRQIGNIIKAVGQSQFTRTALVATLNILEQDNLLRTLARPKLVALSGKEASFLVGGEVPILSSVSVASGSTTTSVEYVEYGIKLKIRPEVKETGEVICQLEVEIKSVDTNTQLTVNTGSSISTSTPGFKTRNATTELLLKNNQTAFLAGLIDNLETNNLARVPGLGNIPILGALFRSKDFQVGATELVISITPRIIKYGDLRQEIQDRAVLGNGFDEDPAASYARSIQEIILGNVAYPLEAQRANLTGSVVLSLHLLSSGQLVGVVVSESSGHKLLDNSAIFTVKRLSPYPAFPKGLLLKEIWVEVPITYQQT